MMNKLLNNNSKWQGGIDETQDQKWGTTRLKFMRLQQQRIKYDHGFQRQGQKAGCGLLLTEKVISALKQMCLALGAKY